MIFPSLFFFKEKDLERGKFIVNVENLWSSNGCQRDVVSLFESHCFDTIYIVDCFFFVCLLIYLGGKIEKN